MHTRIFILLFFMTSNHEIWTQSVGVGTNTPHSSAILDISSTTRGMLVPRMTTLQRDAIVNPEHGLIIFNIDDHCLDSYNDMEWIKNCGSYTGSYNHGEWIQKANMPADVRSGAVGFSIGNKGYLGLGSAFASFYNDLWEYDPQNNSWTQKASLPASARQGAFAFATSDRGYIGSGLNMENTYLQDFWEYNPVSNAWTQKANFAGPARIKAVGFTIGMKGYVGTGNIFGTYLADFWEYDPASNTWTQKASFGGVPRTGAAGFSIGIKGYLGTGTNPTHLSDFWEYNPTSNTWVQKAGFGGGARFGSFSFAANSKGYLGGGQNTVLLNDFWEYDPSANNWTQKGYFSSPGIRDAASFSIDGQGYVGCGYQGSNTNLLWQYKQFSIPYPFTAQDTNGYVLINTPTGDLNFYRQQSNGISGSNKMVLNANGDLFLNTGNSLFVGQNTSLGRKGIRFHHGGGNGYIDVMDGALHFRANSTNGGTTRMIVQPNTGYIGIGTTNPIAPLHVTNASYSNGPGSNIKYFNFETNGITALNNWTGSATVYAEGNICSKESFISASNYSFSDARIKNILEISTGKEDLKTLNKIEITRYTYKDSLGKGSEVQTKVIAQQLEKIMPAAVSKTKSVIPDIMQLSTKIEKDNFGNIIITLAYPHKAKAGGKIKIIAESGIEDIFEIKEVPDNHTLKIKYPACPNRLFVYGSLVDDFRVVDYDAIAMLNVSATQEIYKELLELETEHQKVVLQNDFLQQEIIKLQTFIQEQKVETEARLNALESTLLNKRN